MWTIVGLGNPGLKYKWSRHNIGFQVADYIAKESGIKFHRFKFVDALIAECTINSEEVLLIKPQTYMNRSGVAVKRIMDIYNIKTEEVIVVLDDIDLPWEKLRLRKGGSSGGHKGLQSVIDELETPKIIRLRMGIGRDETAKGNVAKYVLDKFQPKEKDTLEEYCERASEVIKTVIFKGAESAMNQYN